MIWDIIWELIWEAPTSKRALWMMRFVSSAGQRAKTGIPRPAEEVMDAMAECAKAAAADAGVPWEQIRQVGIGVPGTANEETGVVEDANNLLFENVPMREYLQKGCIRK